MMMLPRRRRRRVMVMLILGTTLLVGSAFCSFRLRDALRGVVVVVVQSSKVTKSTQQQRRSASAADVVVEYPFPTTTTSRTGDHKIENADSSSGGNEDEAEASSGNIGDEALLQEGGGGGAHASTSPLKSSWLPSLSSSTERSKILPEPLDLMRRGVALKGAYSNLAKALERRFSTTNTKSECSCVAKSGPGDDAGEDDQRTIFNDEDCCHRIVQRPHKFGYFVAAVLLDEYRNDVELAESAPAFYNNLLSLNDEDSANRRHEVNDEANTADDDNLIYDWRMVQVMRNVVDAVVSGYLYHREGRECWKDPMGYLKMQYRSDDQKKNVRLRPRIAQTSPASVRERFRSNRQLRRQQRDLGKEVKGILAHNSVGTANKRKGDVRGNEGATAAADGRPLRHRRLSRWAEADDWDKRVSYELNPPAAGRSICQYLADTPEEVGLRAYLEYVMRTKYFSLLGIWGMAQEIDEVGERTKTVCFKDLVDVTAGLYESKQRPSKLDGAVNPSSFQTFSSAQPVVNGVLDFLYNGTSRHEPWKPPKYNPRLVRFIRDGHSTPHEPGLRERLAEIIMGIDERYYSGDIKWLSTKLPC